jgi:hypothetical protein
MMAVVGAQFGRKSMVGRKIDVVELTREEGTRLALGGVGLSPDDLRKLDDGRAEAAAWPGVAGALDEETQRESAFNCLGPFTCMEMRVGQWLEAVSAIIEGRRELKEVSLQEDFSPEHSEDIGGVNASPEEPYVAHDSEVEEIIPTKGAPTTQPMETTRQSDGDADRTRKRAILIRKRAEAGLLQCHTLCRLARGRGSEAACQANQYGDSDEPKALDIETG